MYVRVEDVTIGLLVGGIWICRLLRKMVILVAYFRGLIFYK